MVAGAARAKVKASALPLTSHDTLIFHHHPGRTPMSSPTGQSTLFEGRWHMQDLMSTRWEMQGWALWASHQWGSQPC